MDKTGRNGLRIGDLELDGWEEKFNVLTNKHLNLINNFNVDIDFDINKLVEEFTNSINFIKSLRFIDSEHYLNESINSGKKILGEGAQGSLLDIDFGTYPFVTSSNTIAAAAPLGAGFSMQKMNSVLGIVKAYTTRVGEGPFPTELINNEIGHHLETVGHEKGTVTGRSR